MLGLFGMAVQLEAAVVAGVVALATSLLTIFVGGPLRYFFNDRLQGRRLKSEEDRAMDEVASAERILRAQLESERGLQDLRFAHERDQMSRKLELDYEFEQRRELRALIGRYRGRLVDAADK
jgi:hypothetical protein